MLIKTNTLTGAALDWAVCEAAGMFAAYPDIRKAFATLHKGSLTPAYLHPSTDWAQGGPIIEREGISLCCIGRDVNGKLWTASAYDDPELGEGDTCHDPLIAAMRCFVASKLGDEVEVPDELCLRPCRSPYCECEIGKCTHPGCFDARGA